MAADGQKVDAPYLLNFRTVLKISSSVDGGGLIDIDSIMNDDDPDTWLYNPISPSDFNNGDRAIEEPIESKGPPFSVGTFVRSQRHLRSFAMDSFPSTPLSDDSHMAPSLLNSGDFATSLLDHEISIESTPQIKRRDMPNAARYKTTVLYRHTPDNNEDNNNIEIPKIDSSDLKNGPKPGLGQSPKNYGTYRKVSPFNNNIRSLSKLSESRFSVDESCLNQTYELKNTSCHDNNQLTNINNDFNNNDNNIVEITNGSFQLDELSLNNNNSIDKQSDFIITSSSTPTCKRIKKPSMSPIRKRFQEEENNSSSGDESNDLFNNPAIGESPQKPNGNLMNISYIVSPKNNISQLVSISSNGNNENRSNNDLNDISGKSSDNTFSSSIKSTENNKTIEDDISNTSDSGLSSASYNGTSCSMSHVQNLARLQEQDLNFQTSKRNGIFRMGSESSDELLSEISDELPTKNSGLNDTYNCKPMTNHNESTTNKKKIVTKTIQTSYTVGNGMPYKYQNNTTKNTEKQQPKICKTSIANKTTVVLSNNVKSSKPPNGFSASKVNNMRPNIVKLDMPPPAVPKCISKTKNPPLNQQSSSHIPRPSSRIPMPRYKS